ncbi:MAG: amidohydrolase [Oscillospiraceae bacterium]|nr:amidohydrolase [Oscillospiraceae bacterium]
MNYYERALALKEETVAHRRFFHVNAEVGLNMPKGQAYVLDELKKLGIDAKPCGHGVTATVGNGGKCLLLRADMDALPMAEESGLEFACPTGTEAHTCGHDFHVAMLLTAAKMLKENEANLEGTVKFMFQPAEETFEGAKNMLENGILENPAPDAALAYHVTSGKMPVGIYMYNNASTMMFSVDGFKITVHGKGAHGAYPHSSIDPINIAVHIYTALEALIAREVDPAKANLLTIGKFSAGTASNIIPETAELQGTIRSNDKPSRELLVRRMKEIAVKTAECYGGTAEIEMLSEVPPLICDPKLTNEFVGYMKDMNIPGAMPYPGISASASEDFASIADKIPGTFMYLSAGFLDDRGGAPAHNPKVMFNEDVCPIGASSYAHCATEWLKNNK